MYSAVYLRSCLVLRSNKRHINTLFSQLVLCSYSAPFRFTSIFSARNKKKPDLVRDGLYLEEGRLNT